MGLLGSVCKLFKLTVIIIFSDIMKAKYDMAINLAQSSLWCVKLEEGIMKNNMALDLKQTDAPLGASSC